MAKNTNKLVVVIKGSSAGKGGSVVKGAKKRLTGRDRNIGGSPEKRRALRAFIIKWDIGRGASVTQAVVSLPRVAHVIATNKRALNEFVKISKML